ncbi:unnamed protein product, partial [Allacma fusca]
MVFPWGKWYTRSIAERGGREFEDLQKFQDLFLERVKTAYFSRNDSETGVLVDECVIIGDLEGYNNTEFSSLENLKYLIGYFSKFERVYDKFAYGFIINSSTVATQFERLMHSFMAKFTAGTEVYGTNPKLQSMADCNVDISELDSKSEADSGATSGKHVANILSWKETFKDEELL